VIAVLGQKEGTGNSNTVRIINVTNKPERQKVEAIKEEDDE
jgi:ABC-type histidine transport system ATPase subunit